MKLRSITSVAIALLVLFGLLYFVLWRDVPAEPPTVELEPGGSAPAFSPETIRELPAEPAAESRPRALAAPIAADALRCLVVDPGGHPRSGVSVFLLRAHDDSEKDLQQIDPELSVFVKEVRSSPQGYADFVLASRERAYVMAMIERERVDVRAWVGEASEIELRLPARTADVFEIVVVSNRGLAIPEYTVGLQRQRDNSSTAVLASQVVRNAEGRFRCNMKSAFGPTERLIVSITPPIEFEPTRVEFAHDELLDATPHTIVLVEKLGGIRGTVTGTDGKPVADAAVSWAASREVEDTVRTKTDARGVFVLSTRAWSDRGFFSVIATGYAPFQRPIAEVPSTPGGELRIELEPGCVIEGVVTLGGKPIDRTVVMAWTAGSRPFKLGLHGTWSSTSTTGSDGRYRLEHVPQGSILVAANAPPTGKRGDLVYINTQRIEISEPRHALDIRIAPGVSVKGFLDADLPKSAVLFLQVIDDRDPGIAWASGQSGNTREFQIQAPPSSSAKLRIWINANSVCELPLPASDAAIDLGKLELPLSRFHPPDGW